MAHDLHTTEAMINYTVAIFICSVGIAPLIWSPLSGFYGRKPILLASMPIMTVASIGVAQSKTLGAIIGTRILQGIGSSAVLSVGAGTVGDIYRPTERANAMAWFYSGVLLGPALAPVLAGVFTQYTPATWRSTQYFLCGSSALAVLLTALFLPETSHPPTPHAKAKAATGKKFVPYLFNPLTCLGLMRYPNVVTTTMASSFVMLEIYCVMVPMSVIFKERYNITNVAVSGCLYLSTGIGTLIGSRIAGRECHYPLLLPFTVPLTFSPAQADRTVRKYITKRGYRRPEDRLHASLFGAGFLSPVSCLAYGWLLQANKGGLWPPLVMLVINGIGMQLALTPVNTYLVDANQTRSAQALASNNCIRYLFAAAASAFVLPLVEAVGLGWTLIVAAAAQWVGFGAILVTMVWGEKWRERVAAREDGPVEKKEEAVDEGLPSGTVEAEAEKEKEKENCSKGAAETAARRPRRESVVTVEEAHGHDDHDHGEAEHGEPSHLPGLASLGRRLTRGRHEREASAGGSAAAGGGGVLARERSRRGSSSTLPSAGEMLQRTVSLGGASVHGGV